MTYRNIEAYSSADSASVSIDGREFRLPAVVEDEDGIRLLLIGGDEIRPHYWRRAQEDGVAAVVSYDEGRWGWALAGEFVLAAQENAQSGSWVMPRWNRTDGPLTYRQMRAPAAVAAPSGFVHLHAHSEFSALDGLSTVDEMVGRAVDQDQFAIAITDHGVCAGHPAMQKAALARGIKPILGLEANFTDDRFLRGDKEIKDPKEPGSSRYVLNDYRHLILWAENDTGLRNLWAMSTAAHMEGRYGRPRLDWDVLERYREGVMCSTACLRGPIARAILDFEDDAEARARLARLSSIFDGRLWVELHCNQMDDQRIVNAELVRLAKEFSLPTIAVSDAHYPCPGDAELHKIWIATQTGKTLTDDASLFSSGDEYHLMDIAEVNDHLRTQGLDQADIDQAIQGTVDVAQRATVQIEGKAAAPVFSKSGLGDETPLEADVRRLTDMCIESLRKLIGIKPHLKDKYIARFEYEMGLISQKEFCGYFLMVAEYVQWARSQGILVGPGRGSGGGCFVAYLAGITAIDPVENDIMFERFMTPGRKELPDFDIDFPASMRRKLEAYVTERYGHDRVVRVGTQIRFKSKGIFRKLLTVFKDDPELELDYGDVVKVTKIIEEAEAGTAGLGLSWEDLWAQHGEELDPFRAKYPVQFAFADRLVGRLSTYGKHAAGMVISMDRRLIDQLPMRTGENDDQLVAEFTQGELEAMGLVKFDLLTLRTLDTVQMCIDLVERDTGVKIDPNGWIEEYEDQTVWDQVSAGHTLGIFQIETSAGTRLINQYKPHSLRELADVITLVRPGPMRSGLTKTFLRRRDGKEIVRYPDPRMEETLRPTYGTLIYQENILAACMILAGYDSEEADGVRKILGKKKVDQIGPAGEKFLAGCVEHGMEREPADALWNQMAEFAKYSFGLAHAFAYAVLGFWTAWFKFHYPAQFFTAILSTVDNERIPEFVFEARRMGYDVLPPDINMSGSGFDLDAEGNIRYGLDGIKGIGTAVVETLAQSQPFESWDDFLERKGSGCNALAVRTMAAAGVFDRWFPNRRQLEHHLQRQADGVLDVCTFKRDGHLGPGGLPCTFDWESEPVELMKSGRPKKRKPPPKKCTKGCRQYSPPSQEQMHVEPYTEADLQQREREVFGFCLTSTPFDRIPADDLAQMSKADEVKAGPQGQYVVAATIEEIKLRKDRNDKTYAFVQLLAQTGKLDTICFSSTWKDVSKKAKVGALCFAIIFKNDRGLQIRGLEVA